PVQLNTSEFRAIDRVYHAYGTVTEVIDGRAPTPSIRGWKPVSAIHSLSFHASANEDKKEFRTLSAPMDYVFFMNSGLNTRQKERVRLYRYDESTGSYREVQATVDAASGKVAARIDRSGHYVLMAPQF
ncbi:MAG: hypothetical protein Q4A52_00690, partial [Bacillota bacterium]|nr:hypothetical protein [Bacillota bacterium]